MGCCNKNKSKVEPMSDENSAPPPTLKDVYERELVTKRHNCTDVICLIIFIVCCVAQLALSILIYVKGGDPRKILLPHDTDGNACSDSTPYLFYFNLYVCASLTSVIASCPSPTICVKDCPTKNLFYLIDEDRATLYPTYCHETKLNARYSGNVPATISATDYFTLASDDICPTYALNSKEFYKRCLPAILSEIVEGTTNALTTTNSSGSTFTLSDASSTNMTDSMISAGATYVVNLMNLKSVFQSIFEDFSNAAYLIGILLAIACVISFIYIIVLRWVLKPLIYATIIAIILSLSFLIYYCIDKYIKLKDNTKWEWTSDVSSYFSLGATWLAIGIIIGILLLIIILLLIALFKRLRLAIQLICEGSKAVQSVFLTLFFPIFPLIMELAVLLYFISTSIYLSTAGTAVYKSINTTETCSSDDSSATCYFFKYGWDSKDTMDQAMKFLSEYQWLPHIYNLFMMFWILSFIIGFNQMVLAGSFGIWYWSKAKSSCILFTALKDTMIYHLGSVAFGSLIIAIVKLIRYLITYVEKKLQKAAGNNPVTKGIITFVACCCKCFFYCLEKFLKFISKNAYIMVAIYGRNFCLSAVDALKLLTSNPLRAAVLNGVVGFILFLGRLLIAALVGTLAFFFFTKGFYVAPEYKEYFAPDLHYYWVPLIAVILGSYFIATTFFTVFEMAIDTVFLCAMKDLSIHDGSAEKPYFMSTKLLKILDVKNSPAVEANESGEWKRKESNGEINAIDLNKKED